MIFKDNAGVSREHFVKNFYWKVEFQQRGSPRVHGMYWFINGLSINIQDPQIFLEVNNFMDHFISTDGSMSHIENYMDYRKLNDGTTILSFWHAISTIVFHTNI